MHRCGQCFLGSYFCDMPTSSTVDSEQLWATGVTWVNLLILEVTCPWGTAKFEVSPIPNGLLWIVDRPCYLFGNFQIPLLYSVSMCVCVIYVSQVRLGQFFRCPSILLPGVQEPPMEFRNGLVALSFVGRCYASWGRTTSVCCVFTHVILTYFLHVRCIW